MRILTVLGELGIGGTERAAYNFSAAFKRLGHSVAVFSYAAGGAKKSVFEEAGLAVICGGEDLEAALESADDFDPHIIHIHRSGDPNALESHVLRRLRSPRRRILETNVFANVDFVDGSTLIDVHLHLSPWCMWQWNRRLRDRRSEVAGVVVPYPVSAKDFERVDATEVQRYRTSLGIPENEFVIGRSGRPSMHKWHESNIDAMITLVQLKSNVSCLLLGLPIELKSKIDGLSENVKRKFHLLPPTLSDRELSVFYSSLDMYVHASSIGESFGMVLAEAMLCGCPVVTVSTPDRDNSQVDVVGHLRGGVVAGSFSQLAKAVYWLYSHPEVRLKIRQQSRKLVLERFEADFVASRFIDIANIAIAANDRPSLIRALSQRADLVSNVSTWTLLKSCLNTIGRPDLKQISRMGLLYTDHQWLTRMLVQLRQITKRSLPFSSGRSAP